MQKQKLVVIGMELAGADWRGAPRFFAGIDTPRPDKNSVPMHPKLPAVVRH